MILDNWGVIFFSYVLPCVSRRFGSAYRLTCPRECLPSVFTVRARSLGGEDKADGPLGQLVLDYLVDDEDYRDTHVVVGLWMGGRECVCVSVCVCVCVCV